MCATAAAEARGRRRPSPPPPPPAAHISHVVAGHSRRCTSRQHTPPAHAHAPSTCTRDHAYVYKHTLHHCTSRMCVCACAKEGHCGEAAWWQHAAGGALRRALLPASTCRARARTCCARGGSSCHSTCPLSTVLLPPMLASLRLACPVLHARVRAAGLGFRHLASVSYSENWC